MDKVVFSTTLTRTAWPSTRILRGDLTHEIQRLKAESTVPLRILDGRLVLTEYRPTGKDIPRT